MLSIAAPHPASAQARPDILRDFADALTETPREPPERRGSVYVPAYSSIRVISGATLIDLAGTMTVHNLSRDRPLVIERIDYYASNGTLLQSYLREPVAIRPFGTVGVFVPSDDRRGGIGANFVVDWAGGAAMPEPAVETVMIGVSGPHSYSIVSAGRPIRPAER